MTSQAIPAMKQVSGIILCGGRGTRSGGADKPLLPWGKRPLIDHVAARLAPQVCCLYISANRNAHRYQAYGEVVADTLADFQGPLAGIQSVLASITTPWFVVCPGDSPLLPHQLVQTLWAHRQGQRSVVAVADGRQQHLHFLGHRQLLTPLNAYLADGQRSVRHFHQQQQAIGCPFTDNEAFRNVNQPSD